MKKLFFAALVATVAVGGAFASNAKLVNDYYSTSNSTDIPDITCDGGNSSCEVFYGSAYDKKSTDATRQLIPLAVLQEQLFFN